MFVVDILRDRNSGKINLEAIHAYQKISHEIGVTMTNDNCNIDLKSSMQNIIFVY